MTINLDNLEIEQVKGLGFKNHNEKGNELDLLEDGKASLTNQDAYGVYMPNTSSSYTRKGKTYLVTANEGDASEWEEFSGIKKEKNKFKDENGDYTSVEVLDNSFWNGLDES